MLLSHNTLQSIKPQDNKHSAFCKSVLLLFNLIYRKYHTGKKSECAIVLNTFAPALFDMQCKRPILTAMSLIHIWSLTSITFTHTSTHPKDCWRQINQHRLFSLLFAQSTDVMLQILFSWKLKLYHWGC